MDNYLQKLNINENLKKEINSYRESYPVSQELLYRIPKPDNLYYGDEIWNQAVTALLCGENILLVGHKATGKNIFAENLAAAFGRPKWDISFHVNMDAASLIGMDTFRNGEVTFRPGPVYSAAKSGGFAILDEINMAKSEAMAVLHATLDFRRTIDVPGYDRIDLHPATRFIATMNYGYSGTKELNEALVSRFAVIKMPMISKDNLIKQFDDITQMMHKKWPNAKYIGYFQAFTNTYAPVDILKEKYETILALDDVIGLSISTRPDCLEDDVVEYLGELNKRTNLWVELGLQTIHDSTSKLINRGHDYDEFLKGLEKLKAKNIKVIVHIINGLPGEDYNMMMETAKAVANMGVDGIKIHLLHVIKDTPMEKMLQKGMLTLMNQEEYINLVCDQLEILPETMIVHRLTGDGKRDELVGPLWSLKKWEVLNAIDDELKKRNSYQGIKYNK